MERLGDIEAVQRMQDYIEQNIQSPITLRDLSKSAGYSPFHSEAQKLVGSSDEDKPFSEVEKNG